VTAPHSAPPSCVLWVDGVRYADGQPAEAASAPVALTGLTVTWGRATTLDQPAPASCTFEVLDRPAGARFTDRLHVGARVQVRADATIYPDPTVPIMADPGFEAAPVGPAAVLASNATAAVVAGPVHHTGTKAVRIDPVDPARAVRVVFPPAPFTLDPAGWDAVPRTLPGQSWRFGAAIRLPALAGVARAQLHPVAFTQPFAAGTVLTDTAAAAAPDAAGWAVHSALVTPPAGVWLGLAVDLYPTGPTWDELDPALTWDQLDPALTWDDVAATWVDDLLLLAPAAGASRAGEVFTGRVTDLVAQWDDGAGGTLLRVTAQDDTAELANRYVGAAPWPQETLLARFIRILAAAGQTMASIIDPTVQAAQVTYRDVDNQPAHALLAELAQSVGGVLWSATSLTTGPYLRLEDIQARPPLQMLAKGADNVIRIVTAPAVGAKGVTVSACDLLLDPVRWIADSTDSATRVAVGWKDPAPDPAKPTDRTETVVDAAAETDTGQRRVQVSTQLATQAAAGSTAAALLARLSAGGWKVSGLTYSIEAGDPLTAAQLTTVMTLLDGTTRIGLPVMLTDLPDWSPVAAPGSVPLFVEGGRYTNTGGAWQLDLLVTSARSQGAGLAWDQLDPTWTWDQLDPTIRWDDLYGVGI